MSAKFSSENVSFINYDIIGYGNSVACYVTFNKDVILYSVEMKGHEKIDPGEGGSVNLAIQNPDQVSSHYSGTYQADYNGTNSENWLAWTYKEHLCKAGVRIKLFVTGGYRGLLRFGRTNSNYTEILNVDGESVTCKFDVGVQVGNTNTNSIPTSYRGGIMPILKLYVRSTNSAPNKPSNLSPGSIDENNPEIINILKPALNWTYSDPDGDAQSKYLIQVTDVESDTSVIYKTVVSGSSSHNVTDGLEPNKIYKWKVLTYDSKGKSSASWSDFKYIKTASAPVCNITSPLGTVDTPKATSTTPRIEWTYSDVDNNGQKSFKVVIKKKSDSSIIHDSGDIITQNNYYDVPDNILEIANEYLIELTVIDSTDMQSQISGPQYIIINKPPQKPTNYTILNNSRVNATTDLIFEYNLGSDDENNPQKMQLQLATNDEFSENVRTVNLGIDALRIGEQAQYYDASWKDIPSTGIIPIAATKVRFNMAKNLIQGNIYYVRARGIDSTTNSEGEWSEVDHFRYGDRIIWTTDVTNTTDKAIIIVGIIIIKNDTSKYKLLVEASNNANDDVPVWQDVTTNFIDRSSTILTNSAKTAEQWGITLRITIVSTDLSDTEDIKLEGFGFAFD